MLADDELGQMREDFVNIDKDSNHELIVVENESGNLICTLQLSFIQYLTYRGGIRAQIESVRVHKDYRGKGVSRQFFQWAIDRAKQRGAHLLQLTTDKKRPDALRFYESLGFNATHEGMKLHLS
jgi:GNAT superfamily N-acetyltransferase